MAIVLDSKESQPTAGAFRQFLNWLDEGTDSSGEKYLEMRRRLVAYFDRKNCVAADDLADETLNRVARRLEEEGTYPAEAPARYCYITAKFVFLEYLRSDRRHEKSFEELPSADMDAKAGLFSTENGDLNGNETLLDCLEKCMAKLASNDRDLIIEYYRGEQRAKIERRQTLAGSLRLSLNALSIRACRIRHKLELCVRECSTSK
jgi:DNA-directed RNA polymerase specialized sigma24 family protein